MKLEGSLLVLFVALKLCHVIDWSWWWVLSPIWIGLCVVLIGALITILVTTKGGK